jgi:hypothetical protein
VAKKTRSLTPEEREQRELIIDDAIAKGWSYGSLSVHLGISPARVREIHQNYAARMLKPKRAGLVHNLRVAVSRTKNPFAKITLGQAGKLYHILTSLKEGLHEPPKP